MLNVPCEEDGILEIARRARGTPRIALRMLRRVRDYAEVKAGGHITAQVAEAGLSMMNIDGIGLDEMDRRILLTIIENITAGRCLNTISALSAGIRHIMMWSSPICSARFH